MVDREAVVSNAKYLRNVRPIDPEEICEYVTGQPHPAVVRQVLREEAVALGLVECDDGTFVPVSDRPVEAPVEVVEALPDTYADALDELLMERYGYEWATGDSGDQLRGTIRRFKDDYYQRRNVQYDADVALGYAIYHLPDFYAAVQYVLNDLVAKRLLPRKLRVLDVGAGVGGPALGIHDYLPDDALVDYHAVEPSAATEVLEALLDETGPNFHTTVHGTTAEAVAPEGKYDIVLFANVLNELDDPESVLRRYLDHVADDGSLLALAPADRNTSIGLRELERAVADGVAAGGGAEDDAPTVYSPTVRLWPSESPTDRGWSFDVRPDVAVPAFQRRLDATRGADAGADSEPADGEFVNVDVQFSYSILRHDGERLLDVTPSANTYAKMADMDDHVSNRIDLLAAKLSHDLSPDDRDANPLFKISDGSEDDDNYAVLVRETAGNVALATADYGDLLAFDGVLALRNDDEDAYNLVVDEETVVDRIPKPV
ncbi:small ribosomal subunit Rsm22 family protein [Haloarchaeobius iranensis]|uniref:Methyltransferase domain-containing protein n=1 Tax=Haloarchaeobius iranensis TaxID=996166 RepID=A0A1G9WM52_9EURY|nr:class I SAM-dependent methyltransferase [Haloarchaeobius iranensis]SDM85539.1 Methyltransferase domain-containing protein [Haloarchaeobius iranensis]